MFGSGDNLAFRPVSSMVAEKEAVFSTGGNEAFLSDWLCTGSFCRVGDLTVARLSLLLTEVIEVEYMAVL